VVTAPMNGESVELFIRGAAGRLEATLRRCSDTRAAAILCHSHPRYGGSMLDKVVSRTARALYACDFTVLRFNFRGVGKSDGAFEGGPGERDDVRAAIVYLAGDHDEILLGGFSFGAWVALDVGAQDARVTRLLGIGLPADLFGFGFLGDASKPLLVVQGERDVYANLAHVRQLVACAGNSAQLEVIADANHFLAGGLETLATAVGAFASAGPSSCQVGG
jgi:alpha/beta superfamily hydrolase